MSDSSDTTPVEVYPSAVAEEPITEGVEEQKEEAVINDEEAVEVGNDDEDVVAETKERGDEEEGDVEAADDNDIEDGDVGDAEAKAEEEVRELSELTNCTPAGVAMPRIALSNHLYSELTIELASERHE